ncbi:hypothetical protein, partial [Pseudomaricurvus sp.]|uniref:hypothetical protein n=1 Tax=Pseudomaricurvus sp. TaxID=2004510 RepID=UPI003F6C9A70
MKVHPALHSALLLSASLLTASLISTPISAQDKGAEARQKAQEKAAAARQNGKDKGAEARQKGQEKAAEARRRASARRGIGPVKISTLPLPEGINPRSVAFTQSGKLVLRYSDENGGGKLATLNVDGSEFRQFFNGGEGDNDHLLFADGKRIHQGTTIVECTKVFEECDDATVVPIKFPDPLDDDPRIQNRAQEAIIAPDNKTLSWMVLMADYSTVV